MHVCQRSLVREEEKGNASSSPLCASVKARLSGFARDIFKNTFVRHKPWNGFKSAGKTVLESSENIVYYI